MNRWQKEYILSNIKDEQEALKELKKMYEDALIQVNKKIKVLSEHEEMKSKIYQKKYQEALQKQLEEILDEIDEYTTISDFLEKCYETGWTGTFYDIYHQGIPIAIPIDQTQVADALFKETKLKDGLYARLGYNKKALAKEINKIISGGVATSMSFADVAGLIKKKFGINISKSYTIARTEGHRVMTTASYHAMKSAVEMGCDVVKQWDSALDSRTRDSHRLVDGEIRELDDLFSNGLRYPSDPNGQASEVINCRCALLQRATWALDESELKTLQERANYFGLDKSKQFDDFKNKYLKIR